MGIKAKILKCIKEPRRIYVYIYKNLLNTSYGKNMSDEKYLKKMFKVCLGYKLDLKNPVTFNEKLQWLKLYDRNPKYITMVDKCDAKGYVAERIGEEYVVPMYGVWDNFDDIDFDALPNQFVLKTTHDCGGVFICKDKATFDKESAKGFINEHLKYDYFYHCREWSYKNVKPRIIAEKYMEDNGVKNELTDYKFFCFDGEPKVMFIATDRSSDTEETKFDFYDMDFNHLPFTNGHPNSSKPIQKPESFELMKELAEKLSEGIPMVRVDFYECDGNIYFGELTLSHWGGFVPFEPDEWDKIFGGWIKLPKR